MIDPSKLTENDIGRNVTYHREYCKRQTGKLTSWNDSFVFVQFSGPNGEACLPEDVSFDLPRPGDPWPGKPYESPSRS